jgi:hypothetical protein
MRFRRWIQGRALDLAGDGGRQLVLHRVPALNLANATLAGQQVPAPHTNRHSLSHNLRALTPATHPALQKQDALVEHMFVMPQRCDAAQACDDHPSFPTWGGGGGSSNNSAARSPSPGTARCSSARSSGHAAAQLVCKKRRAKGDERGVSLAIWHLRARWRRVHVPGSCCSRLRAVRVQSEVQAGSRRPWCAV